MLDVGCGTGAITAGVAKAVGPQGYAVGIDRDEVLLELARKEHGAIPNLQFEHGDATELRFHAQFDIVTAARVLQWTSEPALAIAKMKQAANADGSLVVLDYNHANNAWEPEPPREFRRFYSAFLEWRRVSGWDNQMADHLPDLFRSAGLEGVRSSVQDEVAERGEPVFADQAVLWSHVMENMGEQIMRTGFGTEAELVEAREAYGRYVKTELRKQTMAMRAVAGTVP